MDALTDSYTLGRAELLKAKLDAGVMTTADAMFYKGYADTPLHREMAALIERRALGLRLMDWNSGGGSGVYAAGSTLFAGHVPDAQSVDRAFAELNAGCLDERALATEMLSTLRQTGLVDALSVVRRRFGR